MGKETKLIWFDFDNAPHVAVLLPVVKEMKNRGHKTILTARDKSETKELLCLNNEKFKLIGKSFPKNRFLKIYYTFVRALSLISYFKKQGVIKKLDLFVCHGSRGALVASWLIRIPSVVLADYEHANSTFGNIFATKFLMPDLLNQNKLKDTDILIRKVDFYPGIKEQIYINSNVKKENILGYFGIDSSKIIIILRPPSITAHYHASESELIMKVIINKLTLYKNKIFVILLPRTKEQGKNISNFFIHRSIPHFVPEKPLKGVDLIVNSDLVLGGGGTITREAAVLGVPSYSFFKGSKGAVDEFLEERGRLISVDSVSDIDRIRFEKKRKEINVLNGSSKRIISFICDQLESLIL